MGRAAGWRAFAMLGACVSALSGAQAQDPDAFYQGRTIDMIVGSEAGSGYDAYARLVAAYLGKQIPGRPGILVKQMIGAGGIVATNYLARIAPRDARAESHSPIPFVATGLAPSSAPLRRGAVALRASKHGYERMEGALTAGGLNFAIVRSQPLLWAAARRMANPLFCVADAARCFCGSRAAPQVVGRFNDIVTRPLLEGALATIERHGARPAVAK